MTKSLRAACLTVSVAVLGRMLWLLLAASPALAQTNPGLPPPAAVPAQLAPAQTAPAVAGETAAGSPVLQLDSRAIPLGGALRTPEAWDAFRARFVTEQGRVIDTANGFISHSEGQGYAMLIAVAANDRVGFERIWGWTRANLMVRDDQLIAWRWEPNQRPAVSDMNNASDGDTLVAWALTEAAELWSDASYRVAARRIAVEVGRKVILNKTRFGQLLLPSVAGYAVEDRADGPIVNLSYWIFPAFQRLAIVAPEFNWAGLSRDGIDLLKQAQFGPAGLPSEWISAQAQPLKPAQGFPQVFGYNAIRIPLYMAWAGIGDRNDYAPFIAWAARTPPATIDIATGKPAQTLGEGGYGAIGALVLCAVKGTPLPQDFATTSTSENYYPATLHLLALIAAQMRYPTCLRG